LLPAANGRRADATGTLFIIAFMILESCSADLCVAQVQLCNNVCTARV